MNALNMTLEAALRPITADELELCEAVDCVTDVLSAAGHGEPLTHAEVAQAMESLVVIVGALHRARGGK